MDPVIALALINSARYSIMTAFSFLEAAGKTEAEIDTFYQTTRKSFMEKDPDDLPEA